MRRRAVPASGDESPAANPSHAVRHRMRDRVVRGGRARSVTGPAELPHRGAALLTAIRRAGERVADRTIRSTRLTRSCPADRRSVLGVRRVTAHGTGRGYQYAKCRCELCRQWMRDAAKVRRDKARAAQPSQWIAPEPVAAHIRTQLANGWPANAVAESRRGDEQSHLRSTGRQIDEDVHYPPRRRSSRREPSHRPARPGPHPCQGNPHSICCQLCEDLEWLLTNGETLPIVALRLGLSEETAAHHIRRYLPGLGVDQ